MAIDSEKTASQGSFITGRVKQVKLVNQKCNHSNLNFSRIEIAKKVHKLHLLH